MRSDDDLSTDRYTEFLEPDCVMPAQFLEPEAQRAGGERRLMRAVLVDAIECYLKHMVPRRSIDFRLFRDAERWIFSRSVDWPFSFECICEALDVDTRLVRSTLRERKLAVMAGRHVPTLPFAVERRRRGGARAGTRASLPMAAAQ